MKLVITLGLCCVCIPELLAKADPNLVLRVNEALATWLLPEALKQNTDGNIVVSPFSLLVPLAELIVASDGGHGMPRPYLSELLQELNGDLGPVDDETILRVFSPLKKLLIKEGNKKGVALETPSRLFVSDKRKLNKSFLRKIERILGSNVNLKSIRFNSHNKKPALAEMNRWVKRSSRGIIKNIIRDYEADPIGSVFLNTVFFKAPWRSEFKRTSCTKGFFLNQTANVNVPYLKLSALMQYAECPEIDSKLLKIPYEYKKDLSLVIILPNKVKEASEMVLDPSKSEDYDMEPSNKTSVIDEKTMIIANALNNLTTKYVNLLLPRFKATQEIELNQALDMMSIVVFQNDGTLTKVTKSHEMLAVYPAIQKVYYEVKEHTVPESGSSDDSDSESQTVEIGERSKYTSMEFKVDRPFQFRVMMEKYTIFAGIVRNPLI